MKGIPLRIAKNGLSEKGLEKGSVILIPVTVDSNGKPVLQAAFPNADPYTNGRPSMRIPKAPGQISERNLKPGMVFVAVVASVKLSTKNIPIKKHNRRIIFVTLSTIERYKDDRFRKRKGEWKIYPGTHSYIDTTSVRITNQTSYRRYPKNAIIETVKLFANGKPLKETHTVYRVKNFKLFSHLHQVPRRTYWGIRNSLHNKKWQRIEDGELLTRINSEKN